ncbi:MAG: sulfatase family protein, partial [Planctomycetota bacterium]
MMRITCLVLMMTMTCLAAAAEQTRPNVILLIADDLQANQSPWDHGWDSTWLVPNMERLAAEGMALDNLHSPSPVCTPSRFCALTGTYGSRAQNPRFKREFHMHGQSHVQFNTYIQPGQRCLPRALSKAGYVTGAVGKNHVVEADINLHKFPYDSDITDPKIVHYLAENDSKLRAAYRAVGFDEADHLYHENPSHMGLKGLSVHNQDWITEGALQFIDRNAEQPFFLYMATTIPHGPHAPEMSWQGDRRVTPLGLLDEPPQSQPDAASIDARLAAFTHNDKWRACVTWFDDSIGALLAKLEERGIDDNTIIILMSDHGMGAKGTTYFQGTRTPALVWRKGGWPGGSRSSALVSHVDLFSTICEWTGAGEPAGGDGVSQAALFGGSADHIRDHLYF